MAHWKIKVCPDQFLPGFEIEINYEVCHVCKLRRYCKRKGILHKS